MSYIYNDFKRTLAIGLTAASFIGVIAGVQLSNTGAATAASCDKVNIVYCGLTGTSDADHVKSLQTIVTRGTDNGHSDLKAVYGWSGASASDIAGMNTTNTKAGILYRNGDVKVGGKVVGNGAWVTARFSGSNGYVKIADGVWARKTTTSFANDSVAVLVHYDQNGQVDFASMINCGNAVKVTPIKVAPTPAPTPKPTPSPTPSPTPKPQAALACTSLTYAAVAGQNLSYKFVVKAAASNTTITHYTFTFSDGTTQIVTTPAASAALVHQFAENGKEYTVTASVSSDTKKDVTASACAVTLTTPTVAPTPTPTPTPVVTPVAVVTPETPKELANTGPGAIVSLFAGTSAFGAVGHKLFSRRRMNRE